MAEAWPSKTCRQSATRLRGVPLSPWAVQAGWAHVGCPGLAPSLLTSPRAASPAARAHVQDLHVAQLRLLGVVLVVRNLVLQAGQAGGRGGCTAAARCAGGGGMACTQAEPHAEPQPTIAATRLALLLSHLFSHAPNPPLPTHPHTHYHHHHHHPTRTPAAGSKWCTSWRWLLSSSWPPAGTP